jgi:plasmid stability protein
MELMEHGLVLRTRVDGDLHRRLRAEAQRQGRSVSNLCRVLLRHGLDVIDSQREAEVWKAQVTSILTGPDGQQKQNR